MRFVLQVDDDFMCEEVNILKDLFKRYKHLKYSHTLCDLSLKDAELFDWRLETDIPIGTLEFVRVFLDRFEVKDYFKPIEIPDCLNDISFLHRYYKVLPYSDLPKTGRYFVKDVSALKSWRPQVFFMETFKDSIKGICEGYENHLYSLQSELIIISEYRVFVSDGEVLGVNLYDGDCLEFPSADTIRGMIARLEFDTHKNKVRLPRSYTLDIAVNSKGDTCLLEMHNFVSCGFYGFNSLDLLVMLVDGIRYELGSR